MLNFMKTALASATLLISGTFAASAQTRTFVVHNDTRYNINHIYVSSTSTDWWGLDRLGRNILYPGYYTTLKLYAGFYDVKLVDEDNDSCIVRGVDFRQGGRLDLDDGLLALCELGTALQ